MNAYRIVTRIQDQDDFTGTPASGQVVVFNTASGKFVASDILPLLTTQARSLSGLVDVNIPFPSGTNFLVYSELERKWVNDSIVDGGNW
jgi:hypothetical protein